MNNIEIFPLKPTDLPNVVFLIQKFAEFEKLSQFCQVSENDLRKAIFGENKFVNCLVAETENALVGYALFFPVFKSFRGERSMFLEDLYVSPIMRGCGLGLKMLREVARMAKEQNCVRMDWQALKWNAPAIEFYKNLGAETDDENLDFRLRGENFARLAS
jgi:GNAT superfamily N-acetyltransferase